MTWSNFCPEKSINNQPHHTSNPSPRPFNHHLPFQPYHHHSIALMPDLITLTSIHESVKWRVKMGFFALWNKFQKITPPNHFFPPTPIPSISTWDLVIPVHLHISKLARWWVWSYRPIRTVWGTMTGSFCGDHFLAIFAAQHSPAVHSAFPSPPNQISTPSVHRLTSLGSGYVYAGSSLDQDSVQMRLIVEGKITHQKQQPR